MEGHLMETYRSGHQKASVLLGRCLAATGANSNQVRSPGQEEIQCKPTSEYTFSVETPRIGLPVALGASYGLLAMSSGGDQTGPSAMEATRGYTSPFTIVGVTKD